jgi:hypothetical protein
MSSQEFLCKSVGELCFVKKPSKDGSLCHDYGDMVLAKQTPLNVLLDKYGFIRDKLQHYVGYFTHKIAIFDSYSTPKGDRIDLIDIISDNVEYLHSGESYTICATKWQKKATFKNYEEGPFYKWQTRNGFFFILTQKEVDTLTDKEKHSLCIK